MASAAKAISSAMTLADKQMYEEKRLKKAVESELVLLKPSDPREQRNAPKRTGQVALVNEA